MKVKVTHNTSKNGIEVKFPAKPDEVHREWLKANKFRFSRGQGLWYNRYSVALMGVVCAYFEVSPTVNDGAGEVPAIPGIASEALGVEAAS